VNARIAAERLANQHIEGPRFRDAEDVVSWLGAVQAQDYRAALWAVGLRLRHRSDAAAVERAFDEGRILRSHLLRPTWHFVAAPDIHWILELTAPHVQRRVAAYHSSVGLDGDTCRRAMKVIARAVKDGQHVTRAELGAHLARAGVKVKGVALALLTLHAELDRVICSGRQRGAQLTYALLDARAPRPTRLSKDEALAALATRYLRSHGPATLRDFVWWSGLATADARRALHASGGTHDAIGDRVYWRLDGDRPQRDRGMHVHLLPIYDEYLVAYRDLDAVPRAAASFGVLPRAVVAGGQVAGTWKAVRGGDGVVVDVKPARRLAGKERDALEQAAARYGRFLGTPVSVKGH
jgi:hypothetical protein